MLATLDPTRWSPVWIGAAALAFVLSCAASSVAVLAVFVRFARVRSTIWDSLRDNAYGMYLLHFPVVSWLQYAALPWPVPAVAKASVVFLGTVATSWAVSAALRRVPAIARVL
jgi:surface polysaccharide O-acyltransferase-like enzyme